MDKIKLGARTTESVKCSSCGKSIPAGEQHTYKGKGGKDVYFCSDCKGKINQALEEETKNPNLVGALLGGFIAAVIAGLMWYFIAVLTKREIGYVAIGVGYLIGLGVNIGSGRKRGVALQFISVLVTLAVLLIADYFVLSHFIKSALTIQGEGVLKEALTAALVKKLYFKSILSPIGLLIWGIALYVAYSVPKPRRI